MDCDPRTAETASAKLRSLVPSEDWPALQAHLRLPPRQAEIAWLLLHGHEDKEILATLKISPGTLRTHISRLYDHFNVSSRLKLVVKIGVIHRTHKTLDESVK